MSLAACMPSSFRFFSICLLRARLARSSALMAQPMMRECRGGRSSLLEWQPGHHGLTPCSQSVTLSHWGLSVLTVDSRDSHSALTANTRWRALAAASSALAGDCRGWAQTAHTADCVTPCLTPSQVPRSPLDLVDTGHLQWYLLRESDWQCVVSSHVSIVSLSSPSHSQLSSGRASTPGGAAAGDLMFRSLSQIGLAVHDARTHHDVDSPSMSCTSDTPGLTSYWL